MKNTYSRENLINEVLMNCGGRSYRMLDSRPVKQYVRCILCQKDNLHINVKRYGDGTKEYINWTADVYIGFCRECKCLYLWIELTDQDEIDRENHKLLTELCDQILKSL